MNAIVVHGEVPEKPTPDFSQFHSGPVVFGFGGGLEGAQYTSRETALWTPSYLNPDGVNNWVKQTADARARDSVQNDGYVLGALNTYRDSVVGAQYRLNAKPQWQVIPGATEEWAQLFQTRAEVLFRLSADSTSCWLDAGRTNTFTGMVRLAVASLFIAGEITASAEWIRESARPFKTAVQLFSPDRLCNPNGMSDTQYLRRGVTKNDMGRPVAYSVRNGDQFALYASKDSYTWTTFAPRTPWGRTQMIHILEQMLPDQTRGIADIVSVLKGLRMTKRFKEVVLQNAVVNASYVAAIESELPDNMIAAAMGQGSDAATGYLAFLNQYLGQLGTFVENGSNMAIDGVKIPHFYPGTKLNMKALGTPGGVGQPFEDSLLRHIAAGLGVSYEELSHDYSKVSYSSARASASVTERGMRAKKKLGADRFADETYLLWLEEMWISGQLPYPPGYSRARAIELFYKPLMKEAIGFCTWIGSGAGQIDELKETQAAILRVQSGLSTYEDEIAKLGGDWREVFAQAVREQKYIRDNGIQFLLSAKRPLGAAPPQSDATAEGS